MMNYQAKRASLVRKLEQIQQEVAQEKGNFTLFALLEREDSHWWDVVVSAPWVEESTMPMLTLIYEKLKQYLIQEEILSISHVAVLRPTEAFVEEVQIYMCTHQQTNPHYHEFTCENFNGMDFRHGYIFQCDCKCQSE